VVELGRPGSVVRRSEAGGRLEDGETAYQRGDYATVLRLVRPLANQGVAHAQVGLGVMYALGQGVPQQGLRGYIPFLLPLEREIIGFLLARNQKTFTAPLGSI
jgi:TPR repeat protein